MPKKAIELIRKFIHFLKYDLWHSETRSNSKLHRFGVEALRVVHLVLRGLKNDNCPLHAASLTFRTLMALIPFLVIFFSIAQAIGLDSVSDQILAEISEMPPEFQQFVADILEKVSNINLVAVGGITGVIFLYVIFKLLSGIEESFNRIWGVTAPRNIGDKLRNYLSVLIIAPALMILAQTGSTALTASSGHIEWLGPLMTSIFQFVPILMITIAFVLIYMFLPNTNVSLKAAATGGFTSALLAIAFQMLLIVLGTVILKRFTFYGSLAAILVFLFWLNTNWTILLFGAELAFAIQHRGTYLEEQRASRASTLSKLWVAVAVVKEAIRVFDSPEPSMDASVFAQQCNIPSRLMNETIQLLLRAKIIGQLGSEQPEHYVLLHPPEKATSQLVCELLIADGASPEELGLSNPAVSAEVFGTLGIQPSTND